MVQRATNIAKTGARSRESPNLIEELKRRGENGRLVEKIYVMSKRSETSPRILQPDGDISLLVDMTV